MAVCVLNPWKHFLMELLYRSTFFSHHLLKSLQQRTLTKLLQPVAFDRLFLRSNLVANFNLPASCSRALTPSLAIAAGFISTLNTVERERKVRRRHAAKVMYWIWAARITPCARVPADPLRCVSTVPGADLVRDHRWRMSRDGCLLKCCCLNIYTRTQTDGEDAEGRRRLLSFLFYSGALQTVAVQTLRRLLLLYCYLPLKVKHCYCSPRTHILLMQLLLLLLPWMLIFRLRSRFDLITSKESLSSNCERLRSNASSFITHNYEMAIWLVSDEHLLFGEKTTIFSGQHWYFVV